MSLFKMVRCHDISFSFARTGAIDELLSVDAGVRSRRTIGFDADEVFMCGEIACRLGEFRDLEVFQKNQEIVS